MASPLTIENLAPFVQTYSIIAATLAAGTNLASSIITLPVILRSPSSTPSSLASQWQTMFDAGITPVVTLAMTSAAGFAALAYHTTFTPILLETASGTIVSHAKRNLYVAAAIGTVGLAPYTLLLMGSTNDELARRAKADKEGKEQDTRQLVETWGFYNFWRGTMLLGAAVAGTWASLGQ